MSFFHWKDVQEALKIAQNNIFAGFMCPDLKLYLDPLGPQLVQPIKFIEHFSSLSNLSKEEVVRLLHFYFQGYFVLSEEEFLGVVENQAFWADLTTKMLQFLFAERSYIFLSIEHIILHS